jgi:hypothetical protein
MNRQPILDELARIAGGAVTSTPGIYNGTGRITNASGKSVAVAYSSLRAVPEMQVDGFVHVCLVDETASPLDTGPFDLTTHRIRMQLMVSVSRSDMFTATRLLEEFVPAYYTAYSGVTLGGLVSSSGIVSTRGPFGVEPLYPERHALEFIFEAVQKGAYLRVA